MEKITSGGYIQIHWDQKYRSKFFSGNAEEAFAPLSLSEQSFR